jgi:hypothetical protein
MPDENNPSPCDQERCKSALIAYETAKDELEDAVKVVNQVKDGKNLAEAGTAGGVGSVAAGGVIIATGGSATGTVALAVALTGWGLIAIGVLFVIGMAYASYRTNQDLSKARELCEKARDTFLATKKKLMEYCPRECWPDFPSDLTCS